MQKTLQSEILAVLREGDASLVTLAKLRKHRANIIYDLQILIKELKIRSYIKIDPDSKSKSLSGAIWFHYTGNYSEMEDVCDLIDEMHGEKKIDGEKKIAGDTISARLAFKSLYTDRGMKTEAVRKKMIKKFMRDTDKGNWSAQQEKMMPTREDIEKDTERLVGLLSMGVPSLREKVAYCLSYKIINKDKSESYPLYDRAWIPEPQT